MKHPSLAIRLVPVLLVAGALASSLMTTARAADRHAGYYYPAKVSTETYVARAKQLGGVNRIRRLVFVTAISNKLWSGGYPPPYVMFSKGATGEKLIIVGMGNYFSTLFQARALLAILSAQARTAKMFREFNIDGRLTFYDLAYMMGFEQITISDGRTFAHQIKLERSTDQ